MAKPGKHDYWRCRDADCQRRDCQAYKEGFEAGFEAGMAAAADED